MIITASASPLSPGTYASWAKWEWMVEVIDADGRKVERRYGPATTRRAAIKHAKSVKREIECTQTRGTP